MANGNSGPDTIFFDSSITTITLTLALPEITEEVEIDGSGGSLDEVLLDGSGIATGDGLDINGASNSNISHLVLTGLPGSGARVRNGSPGVTFDSCTFILNGDGGVALEDEATISNSFIGTDATGQIGFGNTGNGITVSSTDGPSTITLNTIASNAGSGVTISSATAYISRNFMGINTASDTGLGNTGAGIQIESSANIGSVIDANIVCSNGAQGIVANSGSTISNNLIGTDSSGTTGLGNGAQGIRPTNGNHIITGNTVASSPNIGIQMSFGSAILTGNYVGTNAAGATGLGNSGNGIKADTGSTDSFISGNTVAGNFSVGIQLVRRATIENNYIGTNVAGANLQIRAVVSALVVPHPLALFGETPSGLMTGTESLPVRQR